MQLLVDLLVQNKSRQVLKGTVVEYFGEDVCQLIFWRQVCELKLLHSDKFSDVMIFHA